MVSNAALSIHIAISLFCLGSRLPVDFTVAQGPIV